MMRQDSGMRDTGRLPLRAVGGSVVAVSDLAVCSKSEFDLFNQRGMLLLKAGSPITATFLERLNNRELKSVIVKRPSPEPHQTACEAPEPQPPDSSLLTPIEILNATESLFAINELVAEKAHAPTYSERNARSDERYAFDEALALGSIDSEHYFTPICDAWGLDISNQGAGLLTEQAVPIRKRLIMRLNLRAPKRHLFTFVKIVRCQKLIGNIHLVGALFTFEDDSG